MEATGFVTSKQEAQPAGLPARGFWPVAALVLVAVVLFVGWRSFMNEQFAWLVNGVPENVFASLGRFSRFSYLAGPLAIAALLLAARRRFRIGLPEVTLLSLLSVSLTAALSAAAVIAAFTSIGRSGVGALVRVTDAMTASVAPLSTAIAACGVCVLGMALIAMVQRNRPSPSSSPALVPMPIGMALGLSFLAIVSVLSIDQVLRAHREITQAIVVLTDPIKVTAAGGGAFASRLEVSGTVLLWGTFLTLMLPLAGIATWRASRLRIAHPVHHVDGPHRRGRRARCLRLACASDPRRSRFVSGRAHQNEGDGPALTKTGIATHPPGTPGQVRRDPAR